MRSLYAVLAADSSGTVHRLVLKADSNKEIMQMVRNRLGTVDDCHMAVIEPYAEDITNQSYRTAKKWLDTHDGQM